jgi:hypothetical protein
MNPSPQNHRAPSLPLHFCENFLIPVGSWGNSPEEDPACALLPTAPSILIYQYDSSLQAAWGAGPGLGPTRPQPHRAHLTLSRSLHLHHLLWTPADICTVTAHMPALQDCVCPPSWSLLKSPKPYLVIVSSFTSSNHTAQFSRASFTSYLL